MCQLHKTTCAEAGDVPDAPVVAELGAKPLNYGPR